MQNAVSLRTISFDPSSRFVAVPFTAWRYTDKRYDTAAELVDLHAHVTLAGPIATALPASGWVERAVFVDGHLITLGPNGVSSVEYAAGERYPTL